jgi:CheY-like chemotaxis protein
MTRPLTMLFYERLFPGSQLVNRLEELGYRVQVVADPGDLEPRAEKEKPLVIIAEVDSQPDLVCRAIASLGKNDATAHVPVIAMAAAHNAAAQQAARNAGAALVVHDTAILAHLKQFLEQALHVE